MRFFTKTSRISKYSYGIFIWQTTKIEKRQTSCVARRRMPGNVTIQVDGAKSTVEVPAEQPEFRGSFPSKQAPIPSVCVCMCICVCFCAFVCVLGFVIDIHAVQSSKTDDHLSLSPALISLSISCIPLAHTRTHTQTHTHAQICSQQLHRQEAPLLKTFLPFFLEKNRSNLRVVALHRRW